MLLKHNWRIIRKNMCLYINLQAEQTIAMRNLTMFKHYNY